MPEEENISVALPADTVAELHAAVESGDYGSVSEILRDALGEWRLSRRFPTLETDELRHLVQEGIDSGQGLDADAVFARLRARFGDKPTA